MTKKLHRIRFITRLGKICWDIASTIILAVIMALFVNVYIAEAAMVEAGPSMQPTLYVGNRVMMEKISYHFGMPKRGDVVIVDPPGEGVNLIKRVIALPGEVIEVRNGRVWINGDQLAEPWVENYGGPGYPATRIPMDYLYILGDNRSISHDSRAIGPVAAAWVKGHVIFTYWPPGAIKLLP